MKKLLLNLNVILDARLRFKFTVLTILMFIGTLLEVFGIALIVPTLAVIVETDIATKYPIVYPLINFLGNPEKLVLVVYTVLFLGLVYFIKVIFLTYLNWRQVHLVFDVERSASDRLFEKYLRQPYSFHLDNNSSILLRNITTEVNMLSSSMTALTTLIIEVFVVVAVVFFLISIEPIISSIVFIVIGLINLIFYLFTKNKVLTWGEVRQEYQGSKIKHLQQGFGAIKDIKIYGREENFSNLYKESNRKTLQMDLYQRFLNSLPRLWMEMLAVISLSILIVLFWLEGRPISDLIPILGVFVGAAFRVMPSFNRILGAIQTVRFSLPAINLISREMSLDEEINETLNIKNVKEISFKSTLALENLSFKYIQSTKNILSNVNLNIECGQSIGFMGTTGAGKSTLLNIILGLLKPSEGKILVDGEHINNNIRAYQNLFGFVPQKIYLTDDTLCKNVAFGIAEKKINIEMVKKALKAANLSNFIDDKSLTTVVGENGIRLSGGQQQRIGIARALYHNPSILVLDEATSALDTLTEKNVIEDVYNLLGEKTILIISHRLSTLENCNKIYQINLDGKVNEFKK